MDAHGFADDGGDVGEVLDRVVGGHPRKRQGGVEFGLEFGERVRRAEDPVEERAGGVGGRVASRDELGEGLRGELFAAEFGARGVFAFHEAREEVGAPDVRGFEALGDSGDGDAGEVFDRFDALGEEFVREVFGVRLELREAAERSRDFAAAVEDLDGGCGGRRGGGGFADLGDVAFGFEHAEGCAKGQVADDVEGEVVEPVEGVDGGVACGGVGGFLGEAVPFVVEEFEVGVDVLLELADGFGGESVADDLPLAGVLGAVADVEEPAADGHKCVVVLAGCVSVVMTRIMVCGGRSRF